MNPPQRLGLFWTEKQHDPAGTTTDWHLISGSQYQGSLTAIINGSRKGFVKLSYLRLHENAVSMHPGGCRSLIIYNVWARTFVTINCSSSDKKLSSISKPGALGNSYFWLNSTKEMRRNTNSTEGVPSHCFNLAFNRDQYWPSHATNIAHFLLLPNILTFNSLFLTISW